MNIAIVGSRNFVWYQPIYEAILGAQLKWPADLAIVSGGARGADSLAARAAEALGVPTVIHVPEWDRYGRSAGYKRNQLIVRDADMLLAFYAPGPKSAGTTHSVDLARKKGIPVHIYHGGQWS